MKPDIGDNMSKISYAGLPIIATQLMLFAFCLLSGCHGKHPYSDVKHCVDNVYYFPVDPDSPLQSMENFDENLYRFLREHASLKVISVSDYTVNSSTYGFYVVFDEKDVKDYPK